MKTFTCAAIALLLAVPMLMPAQDAGKAQNAVPDKKTVIFNEKEDAKELIAKTLKAAKHNNRRVLIEWGGNWSNACEILYNRLKGDRELGRTLLYEYHLILIDSTINKALAESYGADLKNNEVPYFTVLDANGKALVNQATTPFETTEANKSGPDTKKLQEFLTAHKATPLKAEEVLADALAKAEKNDRLVFLHFGAPWCGWCRKLEAWMARPDIAPVFGKEFVDIEVDIDRMVGGKDVMANYPGSDKGGIPWFVMLDAKGKVLADSNDAKGNIGFPAIESEIEHFIKMLKTSKRHLTNADIEMLRVSLAPPK